RFSFQKFHYDEALAFMLVNLVNRADVGVVQRGGRPCFPAEAFEGLRIFRKLIREEFQGHITAKLNVLGLVDDTHSAATELFYDAVMGDCLPVKWLRLRHVRPS